MIGRHLYFKTDRLIIRPFNTKDMNNMQTLFCLSEVMLLEGMISAFNLIWQTENIILKWIQARSYYAVVEIESGAVIGYVAADMREKNKLESRTGCDFALHPAYQNKVYLAEIRKLAIRK